MSEGLIVRTSFSAGSAATSPSRKGDPVTQTIWVENRFQAEVSAEARARLLADDDDVMVDPSTAHYGQGKTWFTRTRLLQERPRKSLRRPKGAASTDHILSEDRQVHIGSCPNGASKPYRVRGRLSAKATHAPGGVTFPNPSYTDPVSDTAELFIE